MQNQRDLLACLQETRFLLEKLFDSPDEPEFCGSEYCFLGLLLDRET
jgi:hypothetical protein